MSGLWRVQGSFYVTADSADDAEHAVDRRVNSALVQQLLGAVVGEIDVHQGETQPWDFNG